MDARHTLAKDLLGSPEAGAFDELSIVSSATRKFAVRIALGAVCRENVMLERHEYTLYGALSGRHGGRSLPSADKQRMLREISGLADELGSQRPDAEYRPARPPAGSFHWHLKEGSFRTSLTPALLYATIEKHVRPVRERSLRVTGYIEINEKEAFECQRNGFELSTLDYGATITFTVDQDQKATGVGKRGALFAGPEELDRLIGEALTEAMNGCLLNREPVEIAAGDYTVVLSPACVYGLLSGMLHYGYFDRRKIDEGRTYLSGRWRELSFPQGLLLAGASTVSVPESGVYGLPPFNERRTYCRPLNIIRAGRMEDLHVSAYWAHKCGLEETHSPFSCITELTTQPGSPLDGQYETLDDLIRGTPRGIYVADLWYLRMVAEMDGVMTGMTRDGVFAIEDGRIGRPLKNMRWHDNPVRMLQALSGITTEKRVLGLSPLVGDPQEILCHVPAIRVENYHFSSVTRF